MVVPQSISKRANSLIKKALLKASEDKSEQLQTIIHPELNFRRNSINLLIARRGVGKTFTVLRELIKLSQLPDKGGYSSFLYVSDKTNDATVNELIKHVNLRVRHVSYNDILEVLHDLIDAKNALSDALEKDIVNELDEKTVEDLCNTLDVSAMTSSIRSAKPGAELPDYVPHTAILLDDAINILKENKFKNLRNILFQNRQPRLTIFICVQDLYGVPVQLRRNCDTIFLFAGMTDKMAFGMMISQLGLNGLIKWDNYAELPYRSVIVIDYLPDGIKIKIC
jgi:hypothetical protein